MDFDTLVADDLGTQYDNTGRLASIVAAASAMDDTTPILLLPVRIETRFVEVDVPADTAPELRELTELLRQVVEALEQLAGTDFDTKLSGTVREKRRLKETVERPLYARVATALEVTRGALEAAAIDIRDVRQGSARDAAQLERVLERIETALPAARTALEGLRSNFQRARLLALFDAAAAHAAEVVAAVRRRVLPAAAMLREVGGHELRSWRALADSAAAYTSARAALTALGQALAGADDEPSTLVTGLRAKAAVAIAAAGGVSGDAAAIGVLPRAWRERLTVDTARVAERGRTIAGRLERSVVGAGAAGAADRRLAGRLREAMNALARVPEAVRVDVPGRRTRPAPARVADELRVRIFPDDIAVETLEQALTVEERDAGFEFWRATHAAGQDERLRRGAWRALCIKHGSRRAAWIARVTTPRRTPGDPRGKALVDALQTIDRRLDEVGRAGALDRMQAVLNAVEAGRAVFRRKLDGSPPALLERARELLVAIRGKLERLLARVGRDHTGLRGALDTIKRLARAVTAATPADPAPPEFPDVPLRDAPWTQPPMSSVLPDRFLVVTTKDGKAAHVVAGAEVDPELKLGLDPAAGETFGLDDHGDLVVGASIAWMTDYDEALRRGMAVTIPVTTAEADAGFDRVYVLGLKQTTPEQGAALLEGLIDEHHYGESGLALLPAGTATNSTEHEPSALTLRDDPDTSYPVERLAPLFDASAPPAQAADGLRLAQALGIDPGALAHIAGAGSSDLADAALVARVLWPATLGHGMEELLGELLSIDTRDRVRAFALANVGGRGTVPGLRVGSQPYGVLPAVAFTRFVPAPAARFDIVLRDTLLQMHADWTRLRDLHVAHAYNGAAADAQQHFLTMVGQQERAVGYAYRFAVNVARRGALTENFATGPVALLERFATVFRAGVGAGAGPVRGADGQVTDDFRAAHETLLSTRAYELRHVASSKPLTGPVTGGGLANWLPGLISAAPRSLAVAGRRGDGGHWRSLTYLLVRQALLLEYREAALRILADESMLPESARRAAGAADTYLVPSLTGGGAITRWSYLFDPLERLDGRFGVHFPGGAGTLFAYLQGRSMDAYLASRGENPVFAGYSGRALHQPHIDALRAHADDAARLTALAPDRLDALVAEHVDVCSHRLDAWISGLGRQRLTELRADKPHGLFVGAFGWVENLARDPRETAPAASVPAALASDPGPPIRAERGGGFIHAPSIDHAATAAILRSGYLSESDAPDRDNRMAVNLSSRRTRLALLLIDGIRAGNDLGALLGYRLERSLHDALTVPLDDLIAPLRRTFPCRVPVDPSAAVDADAEAERRVVDGLALLQTVQAWVAANRADATGTLYDVLRAGGTYAGYPYGLHDASLAPLLPGTDASSRSRLDATLLAIDALADALDAVGDLVLVEGVHQIARGNHDRAAATLAALAEGRAPLRPEVAETPRRGTLVSQRLLVQLEPADTGALPDGWHDVALSPRAAAEPSLNRWVGELLGPAADVRLRVVDADGKTVADLGVDELGLQPVDLVAIAGGGLEGGLAELSARALDTQRPTDVDDAAPPAALQVELGRAPTWGAPVKSLPELAPLLEAIGELVGRGRPATAHDYVLSDTAAPDGAAAPGSDPDELEPRVTAAVESLRTLGVRLLGLLSDGADDDPTLLGRDPQAYVAAHEDVYRDTLAFRDLDAFWALRDDFFTTLRGAADVGIAAALPPTAYPSRAAVAAQLLERAQTAFVEVATRVQRADAALSDGAANRSAALVQAARAVFGESFAILPRFQIRDGDVIDFVLGRDLASAGKLEEWLTGVSAVRRAAASLSELLVISEAFGAGVPGARALQLPAVDGDPWFGGQLPEGFEPAGDRLSLVVFGAERLDTAGGPSVGLLVDTWNELIPDAEHTTGVTFNYDQPDASPPQCLLLAVPPQRRHKWEVPDLLQTLHDTFELAKNRLVELEHVQQEVYAPLLPPILGELVPEVLVNPVVEAAGSRVILDFGVNNRTD